GTGADAAAEAASKAQNAVDAINEKSSETGVIAYVTGAGATSALRLKSVDGSEISIKAGENLTGGATTLATSTGLQERNATEGAGAVASIDISTEAGAQKAIGIIDKALEQVNATRADLGAANNRLDFTV